MNNLFFPISLPEELIDPIKVSCIEFWENKFFPRIQKEKLEIHNLYVQPDIWKTPFQRLKKHLLKEFGLMTSGFILFPTLPNSIKYPHRDGPTHNYSYSAINIPIANNENSYQVWWPNYNEDRVVKYSLTELNGRPGHQFDVVPVCEESEFDVPDDHRVNISRPYVVNTNIIHGIDNRYNSTYRLVLSLRFSQNLKVENFKELILEKRNYL